MSKIFNRIFAWLEPKPEPSWMAGFYKDLEMVRRADLISMEEADRIAERVCYVHGLARGRERRTG